MIKQAMANAIANAVNNKLAAQTWRYNFPRMNNRPKFAPPGKVTITPMSGRDQFTDALIDNGALGVLGLGGLTAAAMRLFNNNSFGEYKTGLRDLPGVPVQELPSKEIMAERPGQLSGA